MGVLHGIYVGGQGRRLLHCLNARCPVIGHRAGLESRGVRIRTVAFRKGKSPVLRGFQPWIPATTTFFSNIGTPPAIPQARPSFGNLGTGRPGIPSFTPGSSRSRRRAQPVSGTLVQAGRGFPLLHRAHHAHSDEPNPFWEPWYRQAGDSLFYSSRRWICSFQRPSTLVPAHSPCSGRAATRFSSNPASAALTRQFTSLSLTFSRPF